MNLPRFTAEASLYKASMRYSMAISVNAMTNDQKIVPQQFRACIVNRGCFFACLAEGIGRKDCLSLCCL